MDVISVGQMTIEEFRIYEDELRRKSREGASAPQTITHDEFKPTETILQEATRITSGDRMSTYGKPTADFQRISGLWNILFGGKGNGSPFTPSDVALAMCCVKLSRQSHKPKRDNWVDLAGYSHCGAQCDEAAG